MTTLSDEYAKAMKIAEEQKKTEDAKKTANQWMNNPSEDKSKTPLHIVSGNWASDRLYIVTITEKRRN